MYDPAGQDSDQRLSLGDSFHLLPSCLLLFLLSEKLPGVVPQDCMQQLAQHLTPASCSVLQSQPYRSQPPSHQKLYIFNPATSHTTAQCFFLKQENYPLERHPGFTKRLLVMQSYLLHISAYIRHMDINIQPNEFQELTLTVKTNETTAPSTSAQLRGTWKYW